MDKRIENAIALLDDATRLEHDKCIAEGLKDEICPQCGEVFLAHIHFIRCNMKGCPMSDGETFFDKLMKAIDMKTGVELIAIEREEQIEKHGRTVDKDVKFNNEFQLKNGAIELLSSDFIRPGGWNKTTWDKMCTKPYKERLIIAGALLAAEIDRIQRIEQYNED